MTELEKKKLVDEAKRFAEELCCCIQMEELLTDMGLDASFYAERRKELEDF